jgi:hypothetical protein
MISMKYNTMQNIGPLLFLSLRELSHTAQVAVPSTGQNRTRHVRGHAAVRNMKSLSSLLHAATCFVTCRRCGALHWAAECLADSGQRSSSFSSRRSATTCA